MGWVVCIALKIVNEAKKKHTSNGKDPLGLAAAALYIACYKAGETKTQKDIADAAGVTEVTVRNLYKNLKSQINLEMLIKFFQRALFLWRKSKKGLL